MYETHQAYVGWDEKVAFEWAHKYETDWLELVQTVDTINEEFLSNLKRAGEILEAIIKTPEPQEDGHHDRQHYDLS